MHFRGVRSLGRKEYCTTDFADTFLIAGERGTSILRGTAQSTMHSVYIIKKAEKEKQVQQRLALRTESTSPDAHREKTRRLAERSEIRLDEWLMNTAQFGVETLGASYIQIEAGAAHQHISSLEISSSTHFSSDLGVG
eukprot:1704513-Rhodomonas_salina.1